MRIDFIGAGMLARAVGVQLAELGHNVALSNDRPPNSWAASVAGLGVHAVTPRQAAERDVVFLAVN